MRESCSCKHNKTIEILVFLLSFAHDDVESRNARNYKNILTHFYFFLTPDHLPKYIAILTGLRSHDLNSLQLLNTYIDLFTLLSLILRS